MSLELFFETRGIPDAPALIFIHGLFGNHRNLRTISRAFEDQYQIYLPDMRNHGQSPHHDQINYQLMSADLTAFMKQYDIEQAILIGHSMGGKVAMLNALQNQTGILGLIILDIAPVKYEVDYLPIIEDLLSIDLEKLTSRKGADDQLSQQYENLAFRQFLLQNLMKIDGQYKWCLNLIAIKNHIEEIRSFPENQLVHFDKPSYFLAGQESDYVRQEHNHQISMLFPNYKLDFIAGASHWLHADQPVRVIEKIRLFLNSLALPDA